jgi:hypothetical protein
MLLLRPLNQFRWILPALADAFALMIRAAKWIPVGAFDPSDPESESLSNDEEKSASTFNRRGRIQIRRFCGGPVLTRSTRGGNALGIDFGKVEGVD